ncbi:MAG TPA: PDZ domain-containing protein [Candidatus Binatia bacterium]|nr:PDZ domain-containing protein [Candidatus Binatia bacterium]
MAGIRRPRPAAPTPSRRADLGLGGQTRPADRRLARTLALETPWAVEVVSVEAGGPAARAGVRPGDVILSLDGRPMAGIDDLQRRLGPWPGATPVRLRVLRGGAPLEVVVIPTEAP